MILPLRLGLRGTALLLAFLVAACASNPTQVDPGQSAQTPLGAWVVHGGVQVYGVRVQGKGASDLQARENAFRNAVELAVGTLLNREVQVSGGQVTRNELLAYSSGYVHDYRIVSLEDTPGSVTITADVWVRRSAIADRLLEPSNRSSQIPADRLGTQHRAIVKEREAGDRLLNMVLADYPETAYDLKMESFRTRLDVDRKLILEISFKLAWNHGFLEALYEAASATAINRSASACLTRWDQCDHAYLVDVRYRRPGEFRIRGGTIAYDDNIRQKLFHEKFNLDGRNLYLRAIIYSGADAEWRSACFAHDELTRTSYHPARRFVRSDERRTVIDGLLVTSGTLHMDIPGTIPVENRIELRVVPEHVCARTARRFR